MSPQPPDYADFKKQASVPRGAPPPDQPTPQDGPGSLGWIPASFVVQVIHETEGPPPTISSLRVHGLTIRDDLHLENFTLPFSAFFSFCHFEGNLHLWRMHGRTLSFENCRIDGGVELRGTDLEGHLILRGSRFAGPVIARDLTAADTYDISGAEFLYDGVSTAFGTDPKVAQNLRDIADGDTLGLSRASAKTFYWRKVTCTGGGMVTLRDASADSLEHDLADDPPLHSWPDPKKLILDGFRYRRMKQCDAKRALEWLALQPDFAASSYATLANAFDAIGLPQDAEDVLAELKRREIGAIKQPVKKLFFQTIYFLIGYGQRPQYALFAFLLLFVVHCGTVTMLWNLHQIRPAANGMLTQTCYYKTGDRKDCAVAWNSRPFAGGARYLPQDYPAFEPVEYSLESFVPIFDLGQRTYWEPPDILKILLALVAWSGIFTGGLFVGAMAGFLTPRKRAS